MNKLFNKFKPLILYFIVGLLATLVEWCFFYLFSTGARLHYILATALSLILSTFSNWGFGRLIAFRNAPKKNTALEILQVYSASAVGILMNMLLMWIFVGNLSFMEMPSKCAATGIVFFYNFFIRKFVIYKS